MKKSDNRRKKNFRQSKLIVSNEKSFFRFYPYFWWQFIGDTTGIEYRIQMIILLSVHSFYYIPQPLSERRLFLNVPVEKVILIHFSVCDDHGDDGLIIIDAWYFQFSFSLESLRNIREFMLGTEGTKWKENKRKTKSRPWLVLYSGFSLSFYYYYSKKG